MNTRQSVAIPENLLRVIKERAAKSRRSISSEVVIILEAGLRKETK